MRPGVLEVIFCCGGGAWTGCGASEGAPSTLPGEEKLSSLLADFEQMLPIVLRRQELQVHRVGDGGGQTSDW